MPVTIFDIAMQLNISGSTVSRALNDSPLVNKKTKENVRKIADRLKYHPNVIAQGLRTGKSNVIAVVTDNIFDVVMISTSFSRSVEDIAGDNGYNIVICDLGYDPKREYQYSNFFKSYQIAGIIIFQSRLRKTSYNEFKKLGVPIICIHGYTAESGIRAVLPDNTQGGFIATQHLIDVGKKNISFIKGDDSYQSSRDRYKGYINALAKNKIKFQNNLIKGGTSWDQEIGYYYGSQLLRRKKLPDGIFCASDTLAVGVIKAIRNRGLKIPEDIAVVGFDDRAYCSYLNPPLTSVQIPFYQMGKMAIELMLRDIEKGVFETQPIKIDCQLKIRESSGGISEDIYTGRS